jgi:hypothetical protein
MPRPPIAFFLTALLLPACASPRPPLAPAGHEAPAVVPAGVTPLTVEQEEDSARVLPDRLSPGRRIG